MSLIKKQKAKLAWFLFVVILTIVFVFSYRQKIGEVEDNDFKDLAGQEVTLSGVIVAEPDRRVDKVILVFEPEGREGKILITTGLYPSYDYGDRIQVKGKILLPQNFSSFNYKGYLAKEGIYALMYWPEISLIKKEDYSGPRSLFGSLLKLKEKLREVINKYLVYPQSQIFSAMVLGDKSKMSEELKEKLNRVGLRHITAISGMHITILAGILFSFLSFLGFWKREALLLSLGFLSLFVVFVGMPASAVRAAIFSALLLIGRAFGRQKTSSRIIFTAALLMLINNPLLLPYDVGFQLSFMAAIGIIYLAPFLERKLQKISNLLGLREILAMTLAAQVFTLPLLIYHFGQFSLIGLLSNILVIPVVPFVFIFGLLFLVGAVLFDFLGWILSVPLFILLSYITFIIEIFSQFPFAALENINLHSFWFLVISYCFLFFFLWLILKREPDY